jgi:hypothetical protein
MPFGSQASLDFFDALPPLDARTTAPTAGRSLFEGLDELKQGPSGPSSRLLYRLCCVDEAGRPAAYPSDHDLQRLVESEAPGPAPQQPPHQHQPSSAPPTLKEPSFQELLAETHKKGGPACSHCGAT